MAYIHPDLAKVVDTLPVHIRSQILASDASIRTQEELSDCIRLLVQHGHSAGD